MKLLSIIMATSTYNIDICWTYGYFHLLLKGAYWQEIYFHQRKLIAYPITSCDVYGARNQGLRKGVELLRLEAWNNFLHAGLAVKERLDGIFTPSFYGRTVKMVVLRSSGTVSAEPEATTPKRRTIELDTSSEFLSLVPAVSQRKSARSTRSSRSPNDSFSSPENNSVNVRKCMQTADNRAGGEVVIVGCYI